jgi:hypothetical protein
MDILKNELQHKPSAKASTAVSLEGEGAGSKVSEDGIVDLNLVLHDYESDDEYGDVAMESAGGEGVASGEDGGDVISEVDGVASGDDGGVVSDDEGVASGEDGGGGAKLVDVREDIPDDEFEAMLSSKQAQLRFPGRVSAKVPSSKQSKAGGTADVFSQGPLPDTETQSLGPVALILVPTRELAMQIHSHIVAVAKFTNIKVRKGAEVISYTSL